MVHRGQANAFPALPTQGVVDDEKQRLIGGNPGGGEAEHDLADIVEGPLSAGEEPVEDGDVTLTHGSCSHDHRRHGASPQAVHPAGDQGDEVPLAGCVEAPLEGGEQADERLRYDSGVHGSLPDVSQLQG